jgi:hypothetical protein
MAKCIDVDPPSEAVKGFILDESSPREHIRPVQSHDHGRRRAVHNNLRTLHEWASRGQEYRSKPRIIGARPSLHAAKRSSYGLRNNDSVKHDRMKKNEISKLFRGLLY